jgi:uncharacterized protein (TIGR03905 family)
MQYTYETTGTCASMIVVDVNENNSTVDSVQFIGGCNGNTKGIAALCKGKTIDEIISCLKGIQCGMKGTSCPDQLAIALEEIKEEL